MTTITMTSRQAEMYDSDDARSLDRLWVELESAYGERDDYSGPVTILHPDGFVIGRWAGHAAA